MPIPADKTEFIWEDLKKEYEELGWAKTIEFPWIVYDQRTNRILKFTYRFESDSGPCSNKICRGSVYVFLQLRSTGVQWTCASCRKTTGPLAFEDGVSLHPPQEIDYDTAMAIVKESGQRVPLGLTPQMRRRRIIHRK